jgi:hypothetical protein
MPFEQQDGHMLITGNRGAGILVASACLQMADD